MFYFVVCICSLLMRNKLTSGARTIHVVLYWVQALFRILIYRFVVYSVVFLCLFSHVCNEDTFWCVHFSYS
jgi:hypothetical protein